MEDIKKLIRDKQENDFLSSAKKSIENIPEGDSTTFICTACGGKAVAYKPKSGEIWASCTKCGTTILD